MAYLGPEWGRMAVATLAGAEVRDALRGLSLSVLIRVADPPPGRCNWIYAAFEDGAVADVRMGDQPDPGPPLPPATFTVSGTYSTFAAIRRGETTEQKALLGGGLRLQGNRLKALRHLGALVALAEALSGIPCEP